MATLDPIRDEPRVGHAWRMLPTETLRPYERKRRSRELAAIALLPVGLAMAYMGVTIGMACTSTLLYGTCADHALALPGLLTALTGGSFALVGIASILTWRGRETGPRHARAPGGVDPAVLGQAERRGNVLFLALVGVVLVVVELIPLYDVAQVIAKSPSTFDAGFFEAYVALWLLADAILLALGYVWLRTG